VKASQTPEFRRTRVPFIDLPSSVSALRGGGTEEGGLQPQRARSRGGTRREPPAGG
jgi:hypothetical protein